MWNLQHIPKQIFFYWGSPRMSFLRWMTLYSFRKFNPDWKIYLYVPVNQNHDILWTNKMFDNHHHVDFVDYSNRFAGLDIEVVQFDFNVLNHDNNLNEIHKSDLIRYYLLSTLGGVYSDMDILWIAPMNNMLMNKINTDKSTYIYYGICPGYTHDLGHAIGFLMSSENNQYFRDVYHDASALLRQGSTEYQLIGSDLLNRNYRESDMIRRYGSSIGFIDKDCVYSIDHDSYEFLYNKLNLDLINENSIGIHWYGGSEYVKELIHNINHENYLNFNNNGTLVHYLKTKFPKVDVL